MPHLPTAVVLPLVLSLLCPPPQTAGSPDPKLLDKVAKDLEKLAPDLAEAGAGPEAERLALEVRRLLAGEDKRRERFDKAFNAALTEGQEEVPSAKELQRAIETVAGVAERLAAVAEGLTDAAARESWTTRALELDGQSPTARRLAGDVQDVDGQWLRPLQATVEARRHELEAALVRCRNLELEVHAEEVDEGFLSAVLERPVTRLEFDLLTFDTAWPAERGRAFLQDLGRASAFSAALLGGAEQTYTVPLQAYHVLRLDDFERALERMLARGYPGDDEYRTMDREVRANLGAAWMEPEPSGDPALRRTDSELLTRAYAHYLIGNLLFELDPNLSTRPTGLAAYDGHVPIWFRVGHMRHVVGRVCGGSHSPWWATTVTESRTTADPAADRSFEFTLRSAGFVGSRRWLADQVRRKAAPSLASCLLGTVSELDDAKLIKATSVVEYLHELGQAQGFLERYAALAADVDRNRVAGQRLAWTEEALGLSLDQFELQWAEWLLDFEDGSVAGLLRRRLTPADAPSRDQARVLEQLAAVRERVGLSPPTFDPELSRGAQAHADYLELNPDQKLVWPDAHEQFQDRPGFSALGAAAGANSVISFRGPAQAVNDWIDTFYHRLPLLDAGLLGVGIGIAGQTVVLDCSSLVDREHAYVVGWPSDGANQVPVAFNPELPNPVPQVEDQTTLGYPITVQVGLRSGDTLRELRLLDEGGREVSCHQSTPMFPSNPLLAPTNVWCLIPRAPLQRNQRYEVRCRVGDTDRSFSFTTGR
jgi:hypothetical protein